MDGGRNSPRQMQEICRLEPVHAGILVYAAFFSWCSYLWWTFPSELCIVKPGPDINQASSVEAGLASLAAGPAEAKAKILEVATKLGSSSSEQPGSVQRGEDAAKSSETSQTMATREGKPGESLVGADVKKKSASGGSPMIVKRVSKEAAAELEDSRTARRHLAPSASASAEKDNDYDVNEKVETSAWRDLGWDGVGPAPELRHPSQLALASMSLQNPAPTGALRTDGNRLSITLEDLPEKSNDSVPKPSPAFLPKLLDTRNDKVISVLQVGGESNEASLRVDSGKATALPPALRWLEGAAQASRMLFGKPAAIAEAALARWRVADYDSPPIGLSVAAEAKRRGLADEGGKATTGEADQGAAGPSKERNVCYIHLIRGEGRLQLHGIAWFFLHPLQNMHLRALLFFFAVSSLAGFLALVNGCCCCMTHRTRCINCGAVFSVLWVILMSYAAVVISFAHWIPWEVYDSALDARGVVPWLTLYAMSAIVLLQVGLPGTMLVLLCGCLPCLPCCAPLLLRMFRQQILAGQLGQTRDANDVAHTLSRCVMFKISEADVSGENCAICLQEFEEGHEAAESPCHHFFHRECLEKWAAFGGTNCPVCRRGLLATEDGGEHPLLAGGRIGAGAQDGPSSSSSSSSRELRPVA
ncbi:unnamed protein product [Amoebophrya sp. A25]|nr:unnamed protein product [Amoebophrya sp. A25]|eukprot:GSA25T00002354001.1